MLSKGMSDKIWLRAPASCDHVISRALPNEHPPSPELKGDGRAPVGGTGGCAGYRRMSGNGRPRATIAAVPLRSAYLASQECLYNVDLSKYHTNISRF